MRKKASCRLPNCPGKCCYHSGRGIAGLCAALCYDVKVVDTLLADGVEREEERGVSRSPSKTLRRRTSESESGCAVSTCKEQVKAAVCSRLTYVMVRSLSNMDGATSSCRIRRARARRGSPAACPTGAYDRFFHDPGKWPSTDAAGT